MTVVVSKTFTTQETMANANIAKEWLVKGEVQVQMAAVSTNVEGTRAFASSSRRRLALRIGWWARLDAGSCGLVHCHVFGSVGFEFLGGARTVDLHFKGTRLQDNVPVLLALWGIGTKTF